MKAFATFILLVITVSGTFADSRSWPPSSFSLLSRRGDDVIRFEPQMDGKDVRGTRIIAFSFDRSAGRYACVWDRVVHGFYEPDFAVLGKNRDVVVTHAPRQPGSWLTWDVRQRNDYTSQAEFRIAHFVCDDAAERFFSPVGHSQWRAVGAYDRRFCAAKPDFLLRQKTESRKSERHWPCCDAAE